MTNDAGRMAHDASPGIFAAERNVVHLGLSLLRPDWGWVSTNPKS